MVSLKYGWNWYQRFELSQKLFCSYERELIPIQLVESAIFVATVIADVIHYLQSRDAFIYKCGPPVGYIRGINARALAVNVVVGST